MEQKKLLKKLEGRTIFVTGATGLIGKCLIRKIRAHNAIAADPIRILALVRNEDKAKRVFTDYQEPWFKLIKGDVRSLEPRDLSIHYIVHGANETASRAFVESPVETIHTAVKGTENILEYARVNPVESMVFLSSMEVYGTPDTDEKITEDHGNNLDTMSIRACYPISKRLCESMCRAYVQEHNVPAKVIRLTQTFGPGVEYSDERVFAQFAKAVIEGRDIVLNTKGETKRSYLYTEDAVEAILTVLLLGKNGEAYNAAAEETYCSIYEMALMAAGMNTERELKVVIREKNNDMYAPVLHMNLDAAKLKKLGWQPSVGLRDMFMYLIEDLKKQCIVTERQEK